MHGIVPELSTRYDVEIAVMKEMHWSFSDYSQAPEDLIEEIILRLSADNSWERKKREIDEARRKAEEAANKSKGRRRG